MNMFYFHLEREFLCFLLLYKYTLLSWWSWSLTVSHYFPIFWIKKREQEATKDFPAVLSVSSVTTNYLCLTVCWAQQECLHIIYSVIVFLHRRLHWKRFDYSAEKLSTVCVCCRNPLLNKLFVSHWGWDITCLKICLCVERPVRWSSLLW